MRDAVYISSSPSLRLLLSDSSLNIKGNNLYAPIVKVDREEVLPLYVSSAWQPAIGNANRASFLHFTIARSIDLTENISS